MNDIVVGRMPDVDGEYVAATLSAAEWGAMVHRLRDASL